MNQQLWSFRARTSLVVMILAEALLKSVLLVTVYSLIQQLLQLKLSPDEDKTKIDINRLTGFELRNSHWQSALEMLDRLLRKTPSLEFCVLYWLPALDDGRHAKEKSEQLMNLLYKYKQMNCLRLVFVTWGESRLLKERWRNRISIESR